MEPNAVPGLTNRLCAPWVYKALVGWPETAEYFPPGRTEITGVPIRREFFEITPRPENTPLSVLITGGSQGSRTLNNAFRESWPKFRGHEIRFLHQCGRAAFETLRAEFRSSGVEGEIRPFIERMAEAFADADLVVGRSGASAVAELAAAGRPSILVPFPFASGDHQTRNAEAMARAGGALVVPDRELNGQRLFDEVRRLASDRALLGRMAGAARSQARPGAAGRAADVLEQAALSKGAGG
jgi:UDP-N-acetylglucosamine--N-acetylmuramyl-(pentapeptide) pyrophosphoryl-undecaprenol N-acetylglucosamine transferase